MKIKDMSYRPPVSLRPEDTITTAAQTMERAGVGALAIIDGTDLVGIVTDRDLVRRVLATGRPTDERIDSVMTTPVVTIDESEDLSQAYATFSGHAVRRLLVTRQGEFVGMLTVDDLVVHLAANLHDLARPVTAELLFSHRDVAVPAVVAPPEH
jgi:signal-transduction protein with cAMP-binding, CBS, and nucleotidyltransferase domain